MFLILSACCASREECERLEMAEASQLHSRNTINEMNRDGRSDKLQQAINDTVGAIDEIQRKLIKDRNE